MKKVLSLLVFLAVSLAANAQLRLNQFQPVYPSSSNSNYGTGQRYISDQLKLNEFIPVIPETVVVGKTYNATVFYESSTGKENTYQLPVIVNNGAVQQISFNNGGSVHVGSNNSGYEYYGGKLEYVKEYDVYATVVTIVYSSNSWRKFTVVIQ